MPNIVMRFLIFMSIWPFFAAALGNWSTPVPFILLAVVALAANGSIYLSVIGQCQVEDPLNLRVCCARQKPTYYILLLAIAVYHGGVEPMYIFTLSAVSLVLFVYLQMFVLSPVLLLAQYRYFDIEDANGTCLSLLSKRRWIANETDMRAIPVDYGIMLEIR